MRTRFGVYFCAFFFPLLHLHSFPHSRARRGSARKDVARTVSTGGGRARGVGAGEKVWERTQLPHRLFRVSARYPTGTRRGSTRRRRNGRPRSARTSELRVSRRTGRTSVAFFSSTRRTDRNFSRRSTDAGPFRICFYFFFFFFFSYCLAPFFLRTCSPRTRFRGSPRRCSLRELAASTASDSARFSVFLRAFQVSLSPFCRLKIECDKLASEKIEIQRHYLMVSAIAAS